MATDTAQVMAAPAGPEMIPKPSRKDLPLRRRMALTLRESALGLPLLILVGLLVIVPVGFLGYAALSTGAPGRRSNELTFENVIRVFGSTEFLIPLRNSLALGLVVGIGSVIVGGLMAWLVTKTGMKRAGLWENLLVVPIYLSPLMLSLAYIAVAAPEVGFLNLLLPEPLRIFNVYNFAGIAAVMIVSYSGYVFLYMVAPMRALSAELEEAALVLGSSRLRIMRKIILPLLAPAFFASFIIVFTLAAENFAVPTVMGRTMGFKTIPSEIYYNMTNSPSNPNIAAALGLMLLALTFGGIAIYRRMIRLSSRYITVGGKPKAAATFELRRFRWVPTAIIVTWLTCAVVLPFLGLVFGSFLRYIAPTVTWDMFTWENYARVFQGTGFVAIRNTIVVSVLAGTIAAIVGALISYAVMRTKSVGRGVLDYLSTTTIAIPAIALSIGLLWTYVRVPIAIWGTIWILVLAFVTRFLAHGVRMTNISLLPVSPQLDEAGQVLGAGLFRRLRTITFPLIAPGMVSAWMLIFIFSTNEISATVLLYTAESQTIAVRVWTAINSLGAMQAFAYATVQSLIVAVILFGIYKFFGQVDAQGSSAVAGGGRVRSRRRTKAKGGVK